MSNDNIIDFAEVARQRNFHAELLKDIDAVCADLRVDYDAMRRIMGPMSMKERGIVGPALFEALMSPSPSMDQLALLLIVAKRDAKDLANEA